MLPIMNVTANVGKRHHSCNNLTPLLVIIIIGL